MGNTRYHKTLIKRVFILCLGLLLLLQGCRHTNDDITYVPDTSSEGNITQNLDLHASANFDAYLNDLFVEYITSSPLEMSLLISSPEQFGLEDTSDLLDDYSDEALDQQYENMRQNLKTLATFNPDSLTKDQQLSYRIIKYYLELSLEGEAYKDYVYNIKHTLGFHIGLPITMAQIPIETKEDAHNFIKRLQKFPTSVKQLMDGEKLKAEKGYIQPEYISDKVIEQCSAFMTAPEDNFLYLAFRDYVDKLSDASDGEKKEIKDLCLKTMEDYVYPSYTRIMEELKAIKSQTMITSGIYTFPKGKDYYAYLIKAHTGTDITPENLFDWANSTFLKTSARMQAIIKQNPDLDLMNIQPPEFKDFNELYAKCKSIAEDQFNPYDIPDIHNRTIPSYLEKDLPSAFYLPVSIDMKKYGNMFLQNALYKKLDTGNFIVVCHEGIPGHHFQFSIAYQQAAIPNIRKALNFSCYTEGWASYVEGLATNAIDYKNPLINELMICNLDASYALLTLVDLYLHYYGAPREEIVNNYYVYFGDQVEAIVDRAIANPGETLHYAYGRYFMNYLRDKTEEALGDQFDIKEFHHQILINGEMPLFLLEEYIDTYIQEKQQNMS
ncbi:DUF885 domain-containing protein [Vallitalea pronyensis]|uniref:DUF885 domain-containing protein n=1 Tax=Vallitalea pronyensis TaxID=1348613 RepID=A0A8J8MG54_9FIRM|nr:DUF885 domain-containing protein [Vallitalea pronyensis]QUI21035.1 DUF885 domain-containing protein [Vallitalea pronyensis]